MKTIRLALYVTMAALFVARHRTTVHAQDKSRSQGSSLEAAYEGNGVTVDDADVHRVGVRLRRDIWLWLHPRTSRSMDNLVEPASSRRGRRLRLRTLRHRNAGALSSASQELSFRSFRPDSLHEHCVRISVPMRSKRAALALPLAVESMRTSSQLGVYRRSHMVHRGCRRFQGQWHRGGFRFGWDDVGQNPRWRLSGSFSRSSGWPKSAGLSLRRRDQALRKALHLLVLGSGSRRPTKILAPSCDSFAAVL